MKRLLLVGGGQTHVLVLRALARHALDVELTLVTPSPSLPYSGMLPGWVAGHYTLDDLLIELAPLARAAGARVVSGSLRSLDLDQRTAVTDQGQVLHFDIVSIATGAGIDVAAIDGAREHTLPLRPLAAFVSGWQNILQRAAAAAGTFRLTVIGGGAGGVELALAAAFRLRTMPLPTQVRLVTGGAPSMPGHGARARALIRAALLQSGVQIFDSTARSVESNVIHLDDGRTLPTDVILLVTGASAAHWPRAAGLAVDQGGFIEVNEHLQSTSHPFVFAAGDAAALTTTPRPKSGVYAVRAAAPLATNLKAALNGQALTTFAPQRRALYLLSTGGQHAIASWGHWATSGRWVWRWKDRIDRDYIAKLRPTKT
ncbi:MAG: FAD-dependent oxidoreductase [Pseudomonadota bacterium]|nr:FAD-dependent oxidoreductase [Pseudomonadota bacterium]